MSSNPRLTQSRRNLLESIYGETEERLANEGNRQRTASTEVRAVINNMRSYNNLNTGGRRNGTMNRNGEAQRAGRMALIATDSRNPQEVQNARLNAEAMMRRGGLSVNYNGAASRRTRAYANRGASTGMGAAVNNRAQALRERYGDDPRIARAAGNILANATT